MAKTEIDSSGDTIVVRMDGQIAEAFSMATELPDPKKPVDFYCEKVNRINSTGIKKWLLYFVELDKKKVVYRFFGVSAALVEQFNLISNFGGTGKVMSLCLPYSCEACGASFSVIKDSESLKATSEIPAQSCQKCNHPGAQFDDEAEDYLGFLNRD